MYALLPQERHGSRVITAAASALHAVAMSGEQHRTEVLTSGAVQQMALLASSRLEVSTFVRTTMWKILRPPSYRAATDEALARQPPAAGDLTENKSDAQQDGGAASMYPNLSAYSAQLLDAVRANGACFTDSLDAEQSAATMDDLMAGEDGTCANSDLDQAKESSVSPSSRAYEQPQAAEADEALTSGNEQSDARPVIKLELVKSHPIPYVDEDYLSPGRN